MVGRVVVAHIDMPINKPKREKICKFVGGLCVRRVGIVILYCRFGAGTHQAGRALLRIAGNQRESERTSGGDYC